MPVSFTDFAGEKVFKRGVPVKYLETETGQKLPVVTIYDLLDYRLG